MKSADDVYYKCEPEYTNKTKQNTQKKICVVTEIGQFKLTVMTW